MNKLLTLTAVCLLIVFGWLVFIRSDVNDENSKSDIESNQLEDETADIEQNADFENRPALIIGSADAPVTLVEYADFKCPSCNQFHHGVGAQLRDEYIDSGRVRIEFRNYPFIGPDSGRAARGSYCAYDQGFFPAYHDKIYNYVWDNYYSKGDMAAEFRDILTVDTIVQIVADDIRDMSTFSACLEDTTKNKFIDADLLLGADDGVTGTPGFVIGGQKITGPSNYNTFKTLLDIQLR
ncbi:DsbA family protein [Candidatus Saccharibacteria bacterium]|nr:DsbA family protein [Candidatus Saccharibacteria bacterium]MCA9328635.1 DsbA family protein [Candidatus Saccharibacteria bacterium]